jgi:rhodanese-related sulfurtransferase
MNDFISFVIRHWELWLAFVVILGYWLFFEIQEYCGGRGLSAQQVVHLINRDDAVVIDIREPEAYQRGHVLGAISVPEKKLLNELKKLKKYQRKPIILVDAQGLNANKYLNNLIKEGFQHVHYLKNGLQAWQQASMPLHKD